MLFRSRALLDLFFSAYAKHGIDAAKKVSNVDLTVSTNADELFNKALKSANSKLPIGIGAAKPDWATSKDKTAHLLLIANPAIVASRAAFLALSAFNAFGIIDELYLAEKQKPLSISRWWYRSGGDPDQLWKHLAKNRKKKPFFGVPAKIKKLIDKIKTKAGIHGTEVSIGEPVTVTAAAASTTTFEAVLALITAAVPILTTLLATTGDIFKKVKEIKEGTEPTTEPGTEPPVTEPEDNTKKYIMYGAIGLLGVGAVLYLSKRKK